MAIALAIFSALCFGIALVTGRVGLRTLNARSGAAISVPTALALFALAAPFAFDPTGFNIEAAVMFAVVGAFFPALVTLITFRSNERLGPTVTSAISGTAPLFALLAAGLFLDERIPPEAAIASLGVVVGVALLSWNRSIAGPRFVGWSVLWPISGATIRGLAQVGAKAGLLLWANPFAASLTGYTVSTVVVIGADRLGHSDRRSATRKSVGWFAATGVLNGMAVLLMYAALSMAPVSLIAPVVATYPLITALLSRLVLHDEAVTARKAAGAVVTVAAIIYLIAST
jgi:drug/metabolite transporter (DMT)-like permease